MQRTADFAGVWRRTVLYEPIGTLGPDEENRKDVIWMQATDGSFVDIRYLAGATEHNRMKSFAGMGDYDPSKELFTWTRLSDFRAPGAPDVGSMKLLKGSGSDPEQIEEDGVLPGDDYREIWDRIGRPNATTDCTANLCKVEASGVSRKGVFLVVGDWFAITLPRRERKDGVKVLEAAFSSEGGVEVMADAESAQFVWSYTAVMGSTATWTIEYALQPALRGQVIRPDMGQLPGGELADLFDPAGGWQWRFITGAAPETLAAHIQGCAV